MAKPVSEGGLPGDNTPVNVASFSQFKADQSAAAVLFDLDGTLLDTAGDIALALGRAFEDHGHARPTAAQVRTMIGRGAPALVARATAALGIDADAAHQDRLIERFFFHYGRLQEMDEVAAAPYEGALPALRVLHAAGMPMAVVTNKQHRFACGLLRRLGMVEFFQEVVGGDSCERRKPDPQPLNFACQRLGVAAAHALMVGDSVNDVAAARAAGMSVVVVPYGYNEGQDPRTLPADAVLEGLSELPGYLGLAPSP